MKIYGLQKMTLLDYPSHVACTVFLGGCNFRCPYCHNYELITGTVEPVMDSEELMAFLRKRHGLLDGVAITGGEPCLQTDLPQLIRQIRDEGFSVKLDTNGTRPEMLRSLLEEELLDYVAMDIKNSPRHYAHTIGIATAPLEKVQESIDILRLSGVDYEFRTTVVKELHTVEDFDAIGKWIAGPSKYFLQPFSDRDTVPFDGLHAPSETELKYYISIIQHYLPAAQIRGI